MQFRTTGLLLLGAMALPASGTAQTTPERGKTCAGNLRHSLVVRVGSNA
ncbi:MAG: hypothetical protein WA650_12105 [Bradyrhizobium sp.]